MPRELTLTIGDYDRVRPLETGEVTPEGIDLTIAHDRPGDIFQQVAGVGTDREFEMTEMSLSTLTVWRSRGNCPYVAIPAFPSRYFRHGMIYVNGEAEIDDPEDLRGTRVGIYTEYQMTMATTVRGMLQDEYGVRPADVEWFTARDEKIPIDLPSGVEKRVIDEGEDLHEMLEAGDLDALVSTQIPDALGGTVRRLFPEFKRVEREYYERTNVFPIMHTVVIHEDVLRESPAVARSMYDALEEAKDLTMERLYDGGIHRITLPWTLDHVEEARRVFGPDYWPYGFRANREELDALTRYSYEQGLSDRRVQPEELFVEELRST